MNSKNSKLVCVGYLFRGKEPLTNKDIQKVGSEKQEQLVSKIKSQMCPE